MNEHVLASVFGFDETEAADAMENVTVPVAIGASDRQRGMRLAPSDDRVSTYPNSTVS